MEERIEEEIETVEGIAKTPKKRWPQHKGVVIGVVERTWKPGSGKYVWDDKIAMKKKLTIKQKAFVDEYLRSHNATAAYRAAKGILGNPDEYSDSDRSNGSVMKRLEKVKWYLMEKIMTDADECLDIQMELIRNEKIPAAVRHDAIKDRLNRMWIGKDKEDWGEFTGIWEVTITINQKRPEIIEMDESTDDVEVLDDNKEDGEHV